jgi:hypothetical protein
MVFLKRKGLWRLDSSIGRSAAPFEIRWRKERC